MTDAVAAPGAPAIAGTRPLDLIDLSHHNTRDGRQFDFDLIRQGGIAGVIHKASQGATYHDPQFALRAGLIRQAGLVLGAYHFLTDDPADPGGDHQAGNFLRAVGNPAGMLLVVDVEEVDPDARPGEGASLRQVRGFVRTINCATGRYPLIYGGVGYLGPLMAREHGEDLAAVCQHWHSAYSHAPRNMPGWGSEPKLWQRTDGRAGPWACETPAAGAVDRSVFFGDLDELRALAGLPLDLTRPRS